MSETQDPRQQALESLNQGGSGFAAGTLVITKDGQGFGKKPIEEIRVGDWVVSDPDDYILPTPRAPRKRNEIVFRQVTKTFVTDDQPVSHVTVWDFAADIEETIRVTPNHPFYEEDIGRWVPVSQMGFGSRLVNAVFGNILVGKVEHEVERARVYNFEVDEFHTYYVSRLAIWVHNHCAQ